MISWFQFYDVMIISSNRWLSIPIFRSVKTFRVNDEISLKMKINNDLKSKGIIQRWVLIGEIRHWEIRRYHCFLSRTLKLVEKWAWEKQTSLVRLWSLSKNFNVVLKSGGWNLGIPDVSTNGVKDSTRTTIRKNLQKYFKDLFKCVWWYSLLASYL